jgi:two-component system, LytTR family, sensor kinase
LTNSRIAVGVANNAVGQGISHGRAYILIFTSMKQIVQYRIHYLFFIQLFIFGGALMVAGRQVLHYTGFITTFLYAAVITMASWAIDRYVIRNYLFNKQYAKTVVGFLGILILATLLLMVLIKVVNNQWFLATDKSSLLLSWFFSYALPLLLALAITTIFTIIKEQMATRSRLVSMEKEQVQTELNFLKAQINPHFLFNALNTVYFQIDKHNTNARDTLLQFSKMLQYQLYECNQERTPIEKEITFLQQYVAIQQIRLGGTVKVTFTADADTKGFSIAPLLLISFVENAFKYVSRHTYKENSIHIRLSTIAEKEFLFVCSNTIEPTMVESDANTSGGIGLNNTKRRLFLLCPDKHHLQISNHDGLFTVHLKINL